MKELVIERGEQVAINGARYTIENVISFDKVMVRHQETGEVTSAAIHTLGPADSVDPLVRRDVNTFTESEWKVIDFRYSVIEPLLQTNQGSTEAAKAAAVAAGVHLATIYRWVKDFKRTGDKSILSPRKPTGGRKKGRLDKDVEDILQSVLREEYLTQQRHSISHVIEMVQDRCRIAKLRPPSENTIRTRLSWIEERDRMKAREGSKAARDEFEARPGKYEDARWPLSVVQIDHTPVNAMVVDEVDRRTLGRPWITVAIDVFSRMIVGFFLSLDRPSALAVGMCIAQGVLSKEDWLTRHNVTGTWPIWGFPGTIHADNAKEFRGEMLRNACKLYHCDLVWRPVGEPNYGGHIESLCGTLSKKFNNLEGTTFSNTRQRGNYKPHKKAVMTLDELETWLTTLIVEVYHNSKHSGLDDMSPLKRFEQGVFGTADVPGSGLKPRILEEERVRMDLLPLTKRTVQTYGVRFEGVNYYHDVLRKWVKARDPENANKQRTFIFRYDPRDISRLYFHDPDLEMYFEIPYRDITRPRISLWELREAKAALRKLGRESIDEDALFEARERLRKIESESKTKTKKARLRQHREKRAKTPGVHSPKTASPPADLDIDTGFDNVTGEPMSIGSISAFEDVE